MPFRSLLVGMADLAKERFTERVSDELEGQGQLQNVLQDETERIGCWIDNSNQIPDQTVDYLLQNLEHA
mgnify:FL=1